MRRRFVLLLLGFVASLSHAEDQVTPGKLPKDIFPESYLVHLEPNVEQHVTDGIESIGIRVQNPTTRIVLNAAEIKIVSARIARGENQDELTPQYDTVRQTVSFDTKEILASGSYTLTLRFTSKILEKPRGLFVESYQTSGNSEQVIATRMEPADARWVFPCWDEPAFRATFQLSIRTRAEYTAVSNTPIFAEQPLGPNEKIVIFEPTPPLPSYLVALTCGRFEWLEDDVRGIKLRILTSAE